VSDTIKVVLADDQELLRATFRLLLDATPDIEVVGEAGTGEEAVEVVRVTMPDVVLMDIRMPGAGGIAATESLTADTTLRGVHVLVLTTFETDELVVAALRAGAAGYLGKGVAPADLLEAIRTVAAGESLLSPAATTSLIRRFLASPVANVSAGLPAAVDLTTREREVTLLVARGLSNTEIADELVISPATAKTHVNRAMAKVHARDRAQLVVFAYENGLMTPGGT
jgi:DNA-binding NarL/FixJ family response regulator